MSYSKLCCTSCYLR